MKKEGKEIVPIDLLTEAEKEVVRGLAKGYKEPDLAKEMGTYLGKIETQVENIGRIGLEKNSDIKTNARQTILALIQDGVLYGYLDAPEGNFPIVPFTNRETDVMDLVCNGFTHDEIAGELSISPKTVNIYSQNIRLKMGLGHHQTMRLGVARYVYNKAKP